MQMTAMYLEHFGLREAPFRIMPHTEFFFSGAHRGSTLEALIYAITHDEGIVKVSGEVGSGKTMLCRMLLTRLPKHIKTVYLTNPSLQRDEILYALAEELEIALPEGRPHLLLRTLQEELLEIHASGCRIVVMLDEAHAMPSETLEEIRLLSNLESSQHKLMHIVLFGQPELDQRLAEKSMRQLKERITHNFALEPLNRNEIAHYLMFRMRAAGYRGPDIFTPNAVRLIHQASEGLTRRINILADKALLSAFSENKHLIDSKHIRAAITDAQFNIMHDKSTSYKGWLHYGLFGMAGVVAVTLIAWIVPWQQWFSGERLTQTAQAGMAMTSKEAPHVQPIAADTKTTEPVVVKNADTISPTEPEKTVSVSEKAEDIQNARPAERTEEDRQLTFDERVAMTDEWLKNTPDSHFFIQLLSADAKSQRETEEFIAQISARLDVQSIRVYRSRLSGRDRIGVIYGDYATQAEAAADLIKVVKATPGSSPYIRSVSKLR